jgi:hypothetical protein
MIQYSATPVLNADVLDARLRGHDGSHDAAFIR